MILQISANDVTVQAFILDKNPLSKMLGLPFFSKLEWCSYIASIRNWSLNSIYKVFSVDYDFDLYAFFFNHSSVSPSGCLI